MGRYWKWMFPFLFPTVVTAFSLLSSAPQQLTDNAPTWAALGELIHETSTGQRLQMEDAERNKGRGPPHTDAVLRLFNANDESQVRVTLFRDSAAWCPYCQKTWLFLEEKRIPYFVKKVPLNAYGDKPAWYTRKVDGGKLPAIEVDGDVYVESFDIMKLLDATFDTEPKMLPLDGTKDAKRVEEELLNLEKELQRDWFSLVFYPVKGEALETARTNLLDTLEEVDQALRQTSSGPWFLGGNGPSMIDIQYIVQVERLIASALYWKGLVIRGEFPNIDQWLEAFEKRPTYIATKSDYYTHAFVMPSQNGPGFSTSEAKDIANEIYGLDDAWKLPLKNSRLEPLAPLQSIGEDGARHEAAYKLVSNAENIVHFCCRGAGEPGRPSFHAELADPYAEPNYDFEEAVDICLRHVTCALLHGIDHAACNAVQDLSGKGGHNELRPDWYEYTDLDGKIYYWNEITGESTYSPPTQQLDSCLIYLKDRVGVPRDMGEAAAMQLRAHLNWAVEILSSGEKT